MFRSAAILYGSSLHHLDHLAPLATLLDIPLIVDDIAMYDLAKKFYPKLRPILSSSQEVYFYAVQNFEQLITCRPRPLFDVDFFLPQQLLGKRVSTIWCPHGNSDKGKASFFMEGLKKEELLLTYGKRMESFLRQKKVEVRRLCVGNYRHRYYLENKNFYDTLLQKEIFSSLLAKKTILYAPTWKDGENASSFERFLNPLVENCDDEINLIVKPHPNLFISHPLEMESISKLAENRNHILILKAMPVIYPLLNFIDAYLGDMSSIGYDFLIFQKPMFFLKNPDQVAVKSSHFLHKCGHNLSKEDPARIIKTIKKHLAKKDASFAPIRENIYKQTFAAKANIEKILLST